MSRRLLPFTLVAAVALIACQGEPGTAPSLILTTTAPLARTLVAGKTAAPGTPRPTVPPTPEPTPPRDVTPPLPPSTPAPVPSPTGPGSVVGGPTPAPIPTATPGLALTAGLQPADTWLPGPPLRRPRGGLAAGLLGGTIIAAEGAPRPSIETLVIAEGGGAAWRLSDKHDPHVATGTFLPGGISLMAAASGTDALYTAGGTDGGVTRAVSQYGVGGYVDRAATLGTAVKAAAGALVGDSLIVAGGLGAAGPVDLVQRMSVSTAAISAGQPMPASVAGAACAVLDGKVWVVGGYGISRLGALEPRTGVMVYDPAANTWRANGDGQADPPPVLPEARHSGAAAVLDGQLYLVGGVGAGGGPTDAVLVLDRNAQPPRWRPLASLPTPRALLGLVAVSGKLWAIGGRDAKGQAVTTVEVYRP